MEKRVICGLLCLILFASPLLAGGSRAKTKLETSSVIGEFALDAPSNDLITTDGFVNVRGANRFLSPVFLNGKVLEVRPDGRFQARHLLPRLGNFPLVISFLDGKDQARHILRRVIRVHMSSDGSPDWFFNTPYVSQNQVLKLMGKNVNRAELAYFLAHLGGETLPSVEGLVFKDVPSTHWAASEIQYSASSQLISEFPGGQFRPDAAISRGDYVVALVKALELPFERSEAGDFPYKDVRDTSWMTKYIHAGYMGGILPEISEFGLNKPLSHSEFSAWAGLVPQVRDAVLAAQSLDVIEVSSERLSKISDNMDGFLSSYVPNAAEGDSAGLTLVVRDPQEIARVIGSRVLVAGTVRPAQLVRVNGKKIVPKKNGDFSVLMSIKPKWNTINVGTSLQSKLLHVYGMPQEYKDLRNHDFEQHATEMFISGVLSDGNPFRPSRPVSRGYFCEVLSSLYGLNPRSVGQLNFKDVGRTHAQYDAIRAVVEAGILRGGTNGTFKPDEQIRKIEVLVALVRASKFKPLRAADLRGIKIPFLDIESGFRWARDDVKTALYYGLVQKETRFYPRLKVTKADLFEMIYYLPHVQAKMAAFFAPEN